MSMPAVMTMSEGEWSGKHENGGVGRAVGTLVGLGRNSQRRQILVTRLRTLEGSPASGYVWRTVSTVQRQDELASGSGDYHQIPEYRERRMASEGDPIASRGTRMRRR